MTVPSTTCPPATATSSGARWRTGARRRPDTLVVCAAQVRPDAVGAVGAGLAERVLEGLVETGLARGLSRVVAPLQTFRGTVAQWEAWSGLALPGDGAYVVPEALAPLHVDHAADLGTLVEPAVWVRHR